MNLSSLKTSTTGTSGCTSASANLLSRGAKILATAAVAMAATAPLMTAQASIVYTPLSLAITSNGPSVNVGFAPFNLAATVGSKGDAGFNFTNIPSSYNILGANSFSQATLVVEGAALDGSTSFTSLPGVRINYQTLQPGRTVYFGLSFFPVINGPRDFGWVSFTYDAQNNVRLTGWAYENTGAAITVGDNGATVPEPSALLLAATSLGLLGLMRRRGGSVKT